jgi:hypothetical protein
MSNEEKIEQGLLFVSELLPYMAQITENTLRVWMIGLRKYTPEQIEFGFDHFIQTLTSDYKSSKHTPMPGDIAKIIDEFFQVGWVEAWQQVLKAACGAGVLSGVDGVTTHAPQFRDPVIARAVERIGGLKEIALASDDRIATIRAQFRDVYKNELISAKQAETAAIYGLEPGRAVAPIQISGRVIQFPMRTMPQILESEKC